MMRSGWTRSKHGKRPRKATRVSESSETVEKGLREIGVADGW